MKKYVVAISLFFTVACVLKAQESLPVKRGDIKALVGPMVIKDSIAIDSLKPGVQQFIRDSIVATDSLQIQQEKEFAKMRLDERAKADSIRNSLRIYGWTISPRLGERIYVERDTTHITFHQRTLPDGLDVAVSHLGNLGSASQSKIFFDRPEPSRFSFQDVFYYWHKKPEDQIFLNTKIPYSDIFYQESGGKQVAENRFKATLSSNFGKKFNIGFDVDYIYARGFYDNLSNKAISYDMNASYIGDKYSMHAFWGFNNFNATENGGITNPLYITNPDSDEIRRLSFSGKSNEIPVRLGDTWNRLRGRHFYVTNRYDLGNDMELYQVNDSTTAFRKKKDYVAPASIILTTYYNDQRRTIKSNDAAGMDSLFYTIPLRRYGNGYDENGNPTPIANGIKYSSPMDDYMSYYSFKNTLALAMNEGFRDWVKFGLTAFVEYDMRKYSVPGELPLVQTHASENILTVGGVLAKEKGKYLTYKAWAEKNLLDSDYRLEGEVTTTLFFKNRELSAKARAYVKQIKPSYFENNFSSKYWNWKHDFSDIRRVFIGGEINSPSTKTKISGGFERIDKYIYYNEDGFIAQASDVNVISIRLDQKLQAGILHWDNQIVYQKTSNENVLPLPDLSLYSNLYITGTIAKVLHLQLGADTHFHTSYYAPGYNLLTLQYYNQRKMKLGNFPLTTVYLNLLLKNTRFFIMYYNATQGMGNSDSFTVPYYPVNSSGMRLGLSWKFNN